MNKKVIGASAAGTVIAGTAAYLGYKQLKNHKKTTRKHKA